MDSGAIWLVEELRKLPIGLCDGMSCRALQVTPSPSFEFSFALRGGGFLDPLCDEWQKGFTTLFGASEHWAVHRIADRVCEFHEIERVVTGMISLKKVGVHTLALTAYCGYRVRKIGLGVWNSKYPPYDAYREQHRRTTTFAAKLIMENTLIHKWSKLYASGFSYKDPVSYLNRTTNGNADPL
jgi:hypothetical protein